MSHRLHVANLRAAATQAGDTSDAQIARRAGIGKATLSRLVNHTTEPTLTTIRKIAAAYGLTVDDLVDEQPTLARVA